ncbi:hypothetical protein GCM10025868_01100 [Angustibacter aerolatus]|uniref:Uncharacterized protein n=1 Tax=Angustibacter aerolatus TaxID=1162965 RepID=A0ABQ6JCD4_9ACTN|nr:hypothetical protein GCM10025868_01100 [Angustibacter aerolatus]
MPCSRRPCPSAPRSRLGLRVGSRLALGAETRAVTGGQAVERPVQVRVVGTFRPGSRDAWSRDPLRGNGFDPDYTDGTVPAPAYGPFLVDADALLGTGSTVDSMQVVGTPDLRGVTSRLAHPRGRERADGGRPVDGAGR